MLKYYLDELRVYRVKRSGSHGRADEKACTVMDCSDTGIIGSNHTGGVDVSLFSRLSEFYSRFDGL
jgi:hypothetical protein